MNGGGIFLTIVILIFLYGDSDELFEEIRTLNLNVNNQDLFDSAKDFLYAEKFLYTLGGAVTRIMFSKNLKEIIEIYSCDQDKIDGFFLLASEMGIRYKCVAAGKLPLSALSKSKKNIFYSESETNEWYVPEEELVAVLNDKN
jgi:hypothetical protein